jgi:coenzyme F420-reducing hydrogenase alpha subunit
MKINVDVDVHHLARVEGHGNIKVRVRDGRVEDARWEVVETPRFFEAMLKGQHYSTAGILTARICGICSIGHCLASLRATENAFGVTVPGAAAGLRLLAKHGETLQSHYLHLFFLAAPDFLGVPSVLPLVKTNRAAVDVARRLKGLANRLCDAVAGRTTHPVSLQVGGVAAMPPRATLIALRDELERSRDDLAAAVDLVRGFRIPGFARETEFVALKGEGGYPFIGGALASTDGVERPEADYLAMTNEYVVPGNTSKWCRLSRESFAVGALARFNLNGEYLQPGAAALAAELGLEAVCHNPFMNNVAQLVECAHVTEEAIDLLGELAGLDAPEITAEVTPRAGVGVGAVEVPRGILYHCYEYDDEGRIVRADCVIPTTQNNANIHLDIGELARVHAARGVGDEELELLCSMLVRSYDPCISCSVH